MNIQNKEHMFMMQLQVFNNYYITNIELNNKILQISHNIIYINTSKNAYILRRKI